MDGVKVRGIVTRAVRYGESDMLVTLSTLENGVITATARGCLKPKAKLRFAAEPMNFGDYVLQGSGARYIISECSQIESFFPIVSDLEKYYAATLILEVLQKVCVQTNPQMIALGLKALDELAYKDKEVDCVIRDFLLETLMLNGNQLDFNVCNICKCTLENQCYFSISDGVLCSHCKGLDGVPIDGYSLKFLQGQTDATKTIKRKSNMFLADTVYNLLGVRISNHYFTELV